MNKTELVKAVAEKAGQPIGLTGEVVNAMLEVIGSTLVEGQEIAIAGFGTYKVSERAARTGRNPATGATIEIPASKSVSFKASKTLNEKLN